MGLFVKSISRGEKQGEIIREESQAYGWLLSAPLPLPSFPPAVRSAAEAAAAAAAGRRYFSFEAVA